MFVVKYIGYSASWLIKPAVDPFINTSIFKCSMNSWDLSDLDLDAASDAVPPSAGGSAGFTGTSPALFSTPATTATGSTGGCLPV